MDRETRVLAVACEGGSFRPHFAPRNAPATGTPMASPRHGGFGALARPGFAPGGPVVSVSVAGIFRGRDRASLPPCSARGPGALRPPTGARWGLQGPGTESAWPGSFPQRIVWPWA